MGFWSLFEVASMPILQVLIISVLGAFMATGYCNLLPNDARKSLNKIVFMVFTPSLMFASLARTVTLEDIISWWFMPINIGLTFLFGGILGWIVVKILKPEPYLEGLVIAMSSSGNLGNLLLIIVHAICQEKGSPFGDHGVCSSIGLSYASFSMAVGGFYIWTYTYHLIKSSAATFKELPEYEQAAMEPNKDFDGDEETQLLKGENQAPVQIVFVTSRSFREDKDKETLASSLELPATEDDGKLSAWAKIKGILFQIVEEIMAPPTLAAILGLIFGAVYWLKKLIIGETAPLHVIQDVVELLGQATIPCITLILGGNLVQGLRSSKLKIPLIVGVLIVRYLILPCIGIGIVKAAGSLGYLPKDPLYSYVLMVQFTLPPAMNIGTMTQLVDVGQAECSVLFLWTYVVAAFALTIWSTVYMWILF